MKLLSSKIFGMSVLCAAMTLAGCNQTPKATDTKATASAATASATETKSTLPDSAPTYKVATISTFTPFIFRNEAGKTIGFDVDVLTAIGEKEGFKVDYLVVPWNGIFDTVQKGTHDIISSAVVINPERQQLVDFSEPYIESGRMAVVKKDSPAQTIADLKDKKIATQAGTSNIPLVEKIVADKANIIPVETQYLEISNIMSGKADAAFDDSRVLQYYVAKNPELRAIDYPEYPGDKFGFAVKKGNTELLKKINDGLSKIKADGTYNKIYTKWFGNAPTAMASAVSGSATASTTNK